MTDSFSMNELQRLVKAALEEDQVWDDATIDYLDLDQEPINGEIVVKAPGVIAGLAAARDAFAQVDASVSFNALFNDGDRVAARDTLVRLRGRAGSILRAERVALNFLQRLSGTATLTAAFVEQVESAGITILDTRKTTPLMRDLQKYAVRCGGGQNHRRNLSSMVLVKENHRRALGGEDELIAALHSAGKSSQYVEVEVDSMAFLEKLIGAPIDRVMLDNFSPDEVRDALDLLRSKGATYDVEVSGGITRKTIADYVITGVDYISIGALTHSARALDISLEIHRRA